MVIKHTLRYRSNIPKNASGVGKTVLCCSDLTYKNAKDFNVKKAHSLDRNERTRKISVQKDYSAKNFFVVSLYLESRFFP